MDTFRNATETNLHDLLHNGQKYVFHKNQLIQTSDQDQQELFFIINNFVKLYSINNEGAKSIQVIYGPGDLFPLTLALSSLIGQETYYGLETYYYEAMQEVEVVTVDMELLNQGVANAPILYRDLLEEAGRRLHSNIQRLENQSLENTYKKVAHQLIFFARRFGVVESRGIRITLPLTHQDIAEVINVARETVTRELKKLRVENAITIDDDIILPDLEELEREIHR